VYDASTGQWRDVGRKESLMDMRKDVASHYRGSNKTLGDETQRLVNNMEKNYVYGGNITQSLRQSGNNQLKETAMKTSASVLKKAFGSKD